MSSADSEDSAATIAAERAAESLDAEVAAIVRAGEVLTSVGYPEHAPPPEDLRSLRPGNPTCHLDVPGVGVCVGTVAALEYPSGAVLAVARGGVAGLTTEEAALVRGMARVTELTMQMLRLLGDERAARETSEAHAAENARLLATQAALRRVATLVARAVPAEELFAAVTEEAGRILPADAATMMCYDRSARAATIVGSWGAGAEGLAGTRLPLEGRNAAVLVYEWEAPIRVDDYADATGQGGEIARSIGYRSAVGAPIVVEGHLWGAIIAASTTAEPLGPDTEARLSDFTELVATAIANAESRAALTASRTRVIATADETRRRIERDLHDGIQQRLVSLSIDLRTFADELPGERTDLAGRVAQLRQTLSTVLDELQEIARGVHPAVLAKGGLHAAIGALARRAGLPVELNVRPSARLPESVEVAAYYIICEALTNAAKHAQASLIRIDVETRDGSLCVGVHDDGVGGADARRGSGILGLSDRVDALGGSLVVHSPPNGGTSVTALLPLSPGA